MNSIRKLSSILATLAVVSLVAVGCKDKSGDSGGGGAASAASMNMLPADADIVVGANVKQITGSKLFGMVKPMIMAQGSAEIEKLKSTCNLDPFTAVESVLVGASQKNDDTMAAVVKGLTSEQVEACAPAMADGEEKIEVVTEGKVTKMTKKSDGDAMHLGWIDDKTMVFAPEAGKDKAKLEALLASTGGLASNKEMMELVGKADTNAAIWVAIKPDPSKMGSQLPVEAQAIYASIHLDSGLKVHAGIRQGSAETAKSTVDMAKTQLESLKAMPFGKYLNSLELTAEGNDVVIKLALSDADLDALMNDPSMRSMMGMMGM